MPMLSPQYEYATKLGPRSLSQRKQRNYGDPGTAVADPTRFFDAFLSQYGLKSRTDPNPYNVVSDQLSTFQQRQASLERGAQFGRNLLARAPTQGRADELQQIITGYEAAARAQNLGGQVFGGGPGQFTEQFGSFQRALAQSQSLGGTYYSTVGAAQAGAGAGAYLTAAKGQLAGALDASTSLLRGGLAAQYGSAMDFSKRGPVGVGGGGAMKPKTQPQQYRIVKHGMGYTSRTPL